MINNNASSKHKKKAIAVIGIGGIGLRHLQSCANLPGAEYDIYAVDLLPENLQKADSLIKSPSIQYLNSLDLLPSEIDVAIVATQSNVRATVTRQLVEEKSIKVIVLEKVLFQKIEDYEDIRTLFEKRGIKVFVNCPRRLWTAYEALRQDLKNETINDISVKGSSWDIGCNGIHYIDLMAFLIGSDRYKITHFDPSVDLRESKRAGTLLIDGELKGVFEVGCHFILSTQSPQDDYKEIKIALKNDVIIKIKETASSVEIYRDEQDANSYEIPFQSELTEMTVRDICTKNTCNLATYTESKKLHLPFIKTILDHLKKTQPEIEECPIT